MSLLIRTAIIMVFLLIFQSVIETIFDMLISQNIEIVRFHNSILEYFRVNDIISLVISYAIMGLIIKTLTR